MKASILIRTYDGDAEWLDICLRSLSRFCNGFTETVVVTDGTNDSRIAPICASNKAILKTDPESASIKNGYIAQQYTKLRSDLFVSNDSDFVLHVDSDSIATNDHTPESLLLDGKPEIVRSPYSDVGAAIKWKSATEAALGIRVDDEFMRRIPFFYPKRIYKQVRDRIEKIHPEGLLSYLASCEDFSEYNVIGAYADRFCRDEFSWSDTSGPHRMMPHRHFWSHGDISRARLIADAIIASPEGLSETPVIAMAVCGKDSMAFYWWALWAHALGGMEKVKFHLSVSDKIMDKVRVKNAIDILRATFSSVTVYDFQDKRHQYPQAANEMFEFTMVRACLDAAPIMWMEADCIPMRRGWFEEATREYLSGGERYYGPFIYDHMNGTGIYPPEWEFISPVEGCPPGVPFDVFTGPSISPRMTRSRLWTHNGNRPEFSTVEEADSIIPKEIAIYHPSKDGSLIRVLNKRAGLISEELLRFPSSFYLLKGDEPGTRKLLRDRTIKSVTFWVGGGRWHAFRIESGAQQLALMKSSIPGSLTEISEEDFNVYSKKAGG